MIPFSVLDLVPVRLGDTPAQALRNTLDLARHCERWGFRRYWMAEHHNMTGIASAATSVVIGYVAGGTSTIRVGAGGIMLPNHSPLVIAEQFGTLESLYPGRIDLGLGRAPGSDRLTAMALNPDPRAVENFPNQVHELGMWLRGEPLPPGHPFREIRAHPEGPTTPEIWILGSSDYGAQLAAHFGLPYAYAYFFTEGRGTEEALALYRRNYRPSTRHPEPVATICVWALAADSEAEARHLLMTREHWRVGFERGLRTPLLSPEAAAAHVYTDGDRSIIQRLRQRAIVGSAEQVASKLRELATVFALDEIVVNTWTYDPAARLRSYELIAKAVLRE